MNPIYFSTILLEPNRWKRDLPKQVAASDWLDRIAQAGFEGIELFEPHFLLASTAERNRILAHPIPKPVFNSYLTLDPAGAIARSQALSAIVETGARAFKFNFGKTRDTWEAEKAVLEEILDELPESVEAWCECHPGTSVETPEVAAELLLSLGERVKIIIHPFWSTEADLRQWMALFQDRVVHAHIQCRHPDDAQFFVRLEEVPTLVSERLGLIFGAGFIGSFCIEFVKGTREVEADRPELLFEEAVRDREFLLAAIAKMDNARY